jgi:hypothetical protein
MILAKIFESKTEMVYIDVVASSLKFSNTYYFIY